MKLTVAHQLQQLAIEQLVQSITASRQLQQLATVSDAETATATIQRARFVSATELEHVTEFNPTVGSCSASRRFMQLASQRLLAPQQQQLTRLPSQQLRRGDDSQQLPQMSTASQHIACQGARMIAQALSNGSTCSPCKPQGGEIAGTHYGTQLRYESYIALPQQLAPHYLLQLIQLVPQLLQPLGTKRLQQLDTNEPQNTQHLAQCATATLQFQQLAS